MADVKSHMTRFDEERLRQLIENHAHYTNSKKTQYIFADLNSYLPKFVKVIHVYFRLALAEAQQEAQDESTQQVTLGGGN